MGEYSRKETSSNWLSFLSHTANDREILKEEKEIDAHLDCKIRDISEKNKIQPAHFYISAIAIHFYTLTGIEKLSFSLPVTGTAGEARGVAGMTSNILPLEINISPGENIISIAHAVSKELAKILRHQRYRGENIQRKSKNNFGFGPSINLMLFKRGIPFRHCKTRWIKANGSQTHGFAVVLDDQGDGKELSIGFYGSDKRHTPEEMLDHQDRFHTILDQLANHPHQSIAELDRKVAALRSTSVPRSVFENIRNPPSAAVVNWAVQDARQITHLALSLTPMTGLPHPITRLKILVNHRLYLVDQINMLPGNTGITPGTLVNIDDQNDTWQVSTLTGDIILGGFSTLEGTPLSAAALATQAKLSTGDRLPIFTEQQSVELSAALARLTANEPFWLAKLERFNPVDFPYAINKTQEPSRLLASPWQSARFGSDRQESGLSVAAIFTAYLHRLSGEQSFQLGYHVKPDNTDLCSQLASCWVPLDVTDIHGQLTLNEIKESLNAEIALINQSYSFACDTQLRYGNLGKNAKLKHDRPAYALALAISAGEISLDGEPDSSLEGFPLLVLQINAANGNFRWVYNAANLPASRVKQINDHVLCGLEKSLDDRNPLLPIDKISFIAKDEERFLLETLNNTEQTYPGPLCIHRAFEQQVEKTPEAIAVCHNDEVLTYREFDQIANRIAHHLIGLGVKADMRVALCMDRSGLQIATLFGILKSGGCYVPLDPAYPIERLKDVLEDAQPSVLLVDALGEATLAGSAQAATYDVTRLLDMKLPDCAPQLNSLSINQLAYVIFTSGSTGRPKGVMVEHAQVMNLYYSLKAEVFQHYRPQSKVCLNSSLSFDASLQSLLSLLGGHQLHIVPNDIRGDGERLVQFIHQNAIDVFDCTPTQLEMLLLSELPNRVEQLILLIGGEALSSQTWRQLCAIRHFTAFNVYGPTECTVDATLAHISGQHPLPTIGRPLANTAIYVLDEQLRPVPFGAVGHMYISGAGVARGYLNQPELTEERFSPDPFLSRKTRMYRTGDLARYLDDGNLEYLGRDDQQVKINGYRIEPGEIEEKLLSHPQINEAVVIAYKTPAGEKQLASYLVMAEGAEIEALPRRLRAYLGNRLPEFMLPSAYVSMASLPVTPNGKIDHKSLPAPDANAYVHECYQAPQGDTEQELHDIWANILCVEKIGRDDNFFAIGGDSLMAMKLLSTVQSRWNGKITLKAFFTDPTLAHLATLVVHSKKLATRQIVPVAPDSRHPLSFAQNRLWFIEQLGNHDENYQVPLLLKMHGSLDPDLLQRCLDDLIERHASLRSVFTAEDGIGYSKLLPTCGWPALKKYDFSSEARPQTAVEKLYQHEVAHKFTISQGPLVRASLAKTGDDEHYLLLIIHHIVTDGWSMEIMARELGALYSAFHQKKPNPLPVLRLQYPDYAHWQQQRLHGGEWEEHAQFWCEQLRGAPERLTLPTDSERPALQSFLGASVPIALDLQLCDHLRLLSQKHNTTLYMTLMSAWSIVLSRLAGQQDLVVGTPVANRQVSECEAMVGFFVNTLAIRIDLTDAPTVAELLTQVREFTLNAQEHQELPFDHVVERLQPHRSMEKTPLFQVMFAWENFDAVAPDMVGLDVQVIDPQVTHVKFDLELNLGPRNNGIVGSLNYATALFDEETIERHKEYLIAVLEAMVSNENQPVSQIDLVGDAERHLLLQQWNQTAKPYPADCCIHQLFEQYAKQDPDAIALVSNTCTLSYGELNQCANALAHQLIELGVKAEDVVAICADRSPEMVIGILAVLKAGGAYLSLPHDITPERLKFMLDDAKPVVILAEQATLALFQGCAIPHRLLPQTDAVVPVSVNPRPQLMPHNLAYMIYTSGSTGNPKGVLVEHGNLVQQMVTWSQQWSLGKQDKVLQFCNTTFDVSVSEIFSALTSGATLVLRDDQWLASSADFWRLCHQYGISYLDIPYQFWRKLCEESDGPLPPALRLVCISGEAAAPEMLERWLKRYPARPELVNCYGPTETTITATTNSPTLGGDHREAIGRPTANIRIYLLSPEGLVVPRGVIGEVYIGGPGVTRGYLNLPAMTEERFLPDPFNSVSGSRMYRTGDLASYWADGRLQFHGRNDHQVKIRGFRIELGEIETQLNGHLQVKEAAVLAQDHKGSKRLIAYMVAAPGTAALEPMAVRQYLQNRLPDYMIPAAYVLLDKMPITANGKLDRKALPEPRESAFLFQPYEAPASRLESLIADIWQTLLGVAKVGRYDHFFELGGHSLLAVSAVNLINQASEDKIGVSDIFIAPTVKQLAQRLKSQTRTSEVVNLHQYALLPADIRPLPGGHQPGKAILLTGATGFVGRFLLRELLDSTPGKIYCLVRGQSRAESLQRLKSILEQWSLWREGDEQRIIVLHGDIKAPQLGMDEHTYASVSKDVGVIFHSAVSIFRYGLSGQCRRFDRTAALGNSGNPQDPEFCLYTQRL
ncbi:amino acid adenylation domain-containing protein [Serratia sp. L9]|uniref:amino acid adenylation domain-containing protein n=1 Tax=Serratia sp. L9 TaxID=3423946 RepID=UPI003D67FE8D